MGFEDGAGDEFGVHPFPAAPRVLAPVQEVPPIYSPIEETAEKDKPNGKPRKPQKPRTNFWPSKDQEVKFSSVEEAIAFIVANGVEVWLHLNKWRQEKWRVRGNRSGGAGALTVSATIVRASLSTVIRM